MAKRCEGCGRLIREGQAFISENTPATSRAWHITCCPLVPKPLAVQPEPKKETDDA